MEVDDESGGAAQSSDSRNASHQIPKKNMVVDDESGGAAQSSDSRNASHQIPKDMNHATHVADGATSYSIHSKVKDCSKFNTQFSLQKMSKLLSKLTDPQKDIVRKCGFGSILRLKCTSLPNSLILQLAKLFDQKTKLIKGPDGGSFNIDAITVHQILGIPYGGNKVPTKASSRAKAVMMNDTNQTVQAAKIEDLTAMIQPGLVGDKFARIFFLILFGIFLCPSSNFRVSHHYYEGLHIVKDIRSYDWCTIVADALNSGLIHFHSNASKGNTSGKATLGGCLLALVVAYYEYIDVGSNLVDPIIPRILVWEDNVLSKFRKAELSIKHIQIKPIGSTLFCNEHINPSTFRGFYVNDDSSSAPPPPVDNVVGENQPQLKPLSEQRTPAQKIVDVGRESCAQTNVDFESARKVMPGASDLSLRIFCGEIIHPDVQKFIKSTTPEGVNQETVQKLNEMCTSFFKDSVQQYVKSIEPVVVNQCYDMVNSFWSGLQQATTVNSITRPSMIVTSNQHDSLSANLRQNQFQDEAFTSNYFEVNRDQNTTNGSCCTLCGIQFVEGQDHVCSSLGQISGQQSNVGKCLAGGVHMTEGGNHRCVTDSDTMQLIQKSTQCIKCYLDVLPNCEHSCCILDEPTMNINSGPQAKTQQIHDSPKSSPCHSEAKVPDSHNMNTTPTSDTFILTPSPASKIIADIVAEISPTDDATITVHDSMDTLLVGTNKDRSVSCNLSNINLEDKEEADGSNSEDGQLKKQDHCRNALAEQSKEPNVTYKLSDLASGRDNALPSSLTASLLEPVLSALQKTKRSITLHDDISQPHNVSPQKKLKASSSTDGNSLPSSHSVNSISTKSPSASPQNSPPNGGDSQSCSANILTSATSPNVTPTLDDTVIVLEKNLSDLGHKKRALKAPQPLFEGQKTRAPKVLLSELEKDIYYAATKRWKSGDPNPICVDIGRMPIKLLEFGETMRPKSWVGTFAMNVYCEALGYDQSKEHSPKIKKGFLTSAEVDYMKVKDLGIDLLSKKLASSSIKFELNKVDMVMIPILHGVHWWLVVANLRDNRFDVLSSWKIKDEEKQVTEIVRANFLRAFQAINDGAAATKVSNLELAYQDAPQQITTYDCGIFVMNFLSTWDGRRVAPMNNDEIYNHRVKAAVYMLCHAGNKSILPSIKKIMQKHEGASKKKKKPQPKSKA